MIVLCDTGPLVAALNRNDIHHRWAAELMKTVRPPMLTSEAVLTETVYFLRQEAIDVELLFKLLERGHLRIDFELAHHWRRVRTLMARYHQMDLADATMVVLSEMHPRSQVLTIDRTDFATYRRNDRQVIDFVAPPKR